MSALLSVGVIGLGAMGMGMAQSLRRAGHVVNVFDVRAEVAQKFAAEGGVACPSLEAIAATSDILVSVVVNAAQTESVLFGDGTPKSGCANHLKPGSVFVMCSTVEPAFSVGLEKKLNDLGLLYIDAPISGGAAKAASGQMTMMTAGTPAAYAKADAGNSWMFENRMAHVLAADYTPLSAVDIFVKDLGLVLDMARASKFPLPLSSTAHQMFMQASTAGFAKEDDSAVIKIFPGIELPKAK